ncbi:unnamed protein product [Lasius platythorax]|uniref:Uncharacterized protein n=1 Tax=Lasius platythorax TaxID=488582 RepID=A0AAV2MZK4_9HYME
MADRNQTGDQLPSGCGKLIDNGFINAAQAVEFTLVPVCSLCGRITRPLKGMSNKILVCVNTFTPSCRRRGDQSSPSQRFRRVRVSATNVRSANGLAQKPWSSGC